MFPVGANKSYVIATSDLRLFIHASNLRPSLDPYWLVVLLFLIDVNDVCYRDHNVL